jgi:hypothetical protein
VPVVDHGVAAQGFLAIRPRLAKTIHQDAQIFAPQEDVGDGLELVRQEQVVAVEKTDDLAARLSHTLIPGCVGAPVLRLAEQTDAGIRDRFHDLDPAVARSIIDDDQLESLESLRQNAFDGRAD